MSRTKRALLYVMAAAYCLAGYNHLINPQFYLPIMPPGLPNAWAWWYTRAEGEDPSGAPLRKQGG